MSVIPSIMPGADAFLLDGNRTGVLLLHGITASPDEVRWLGEHLHSQWITVYGVRATGHGTDYKHLSRIRWEDWYLSALDGLHLLRQRCDKVVVGGMSMGGLLALLLSIEEPVDGVVIMATPLILPRENKMKQARWLKYFRRFLHMPDRSGFPSRLLRIQEQRGESVVGRVRYDIWATQAIGELYKLMNIVRDRLPEVTAPCLAIYSENDPTVPLDNVSFAQDRLIQTTVETLILKNSGHILTQDEDHQEVFDRVSRFVKAI